MSLRSTDGANSWNSVTAAQAGFSPFISKIGATKSDPDLIFTIGFNGVNRSDDFGESWVFIETRELTADVKKHTIFFHIIAPHVRFKFENRTGGESFLIRHWIPFYLDAGEVENP